jgi:membrane protein DedA with SNARE-associated domain
MIAEFITTYGYLAVLLGTLLEGETILLAAGFACHQGLMDWRLVFLLALFGATLGDQGAFLIGRWKGTQLLSRFPSLGRTLPRVNALLDRYHTPVILLLRFTYGMRIAGPVLLGMGELPLRRFALLNLIGAVVWVMLVTLAGYLFGTTVAALLTNVREVEELLFGGLLVLGGGFWLFRMTRAKRSRKN